MLKKRKVRGIKKNLKLEVKVKVSVKYILMI